MEQRRRIRMRRLVDQTLDLMREGALVRSDAARALEAAGVPFHVICRVLSVEVATPVAQAA